MAVPSREALRERKLRCVYVADAFGELGGVWVREYTTAEIDGWRELCASVPGAPSVSAEAERTKLRALTLAYCLLDGPLNEGGKPLFVQASGHPSQRDLEEVRDLIPAGQVERLERVADALSGYPNFETIKLASYPTTLPASSGSSSGDGAPTASGGSRRKSTSDTPAPGEPSSVT